MINNMGFFFPIIILIFTKTTCPRIFFRGDFKNNFTVANKTAGIMSKIHNNISKINRIGLAGICLYRRSGEFLFEIVIFLLNVWLNRNRNDFVT